MPYRVRGSFCISKPPCVHTIHAAVPIRMYSVVHTGPACHMHLLSQEDLVKVAQFPGVLVEQVYISVVHIESALLAGVM